MNNADTLVHQALLLSLKRLVMKRVCAVARRIKRDSVLKFIKTLVVYIYGTKFFVTYNFIFSFFYDKKIGKCAIKDKYHTNK